MENNDNDVSNTIKIEEKISNKKKENKSKIDGNNITSNIINKKIIDINNNSLNNNLNLNNRDSILINKQIYKNKYSQYYGQINPNFVNITNVNLFNNINYLKSQYANIQKKISNFNKLKEIGLHLLRNIDNINHYLLNNYNNNIFNINFNFNPHIDFVQLINNNNLNNQKDLQIILKSKTDIPSLKKIQKINISTKYYKNINSNINKEMKILENNKINIDDIKSGKEQRTVVRINPIPQNFSSFDISKFLDKFLKIESNKNQRIYKALFAPLSKVIGKNIGYCFVMMVKPKYVIDFYNTFNGINFKKKKCKKPCSVVWAKLQGDDFLNVSNDPLRSPIIFKDIRND